MRKDADVEPGVGIVAMARRISLHRALQGFSDLRCRIGTVCISVYAVDTIPANHLQHTLVLRQHSFAHDIWSRTAAATEYDGCHKSQQLTSSVKCSFPKAKLHLLSILASFSIWVREISYEHFMHLP